MGQEWWWIALLVWGSWGGERLWVVMVGLTAGMGWLSWLGWKKGRLRVGKLLVSGGLVAGLVGVSGWWVGWSPEWRWWVSMWVSGWVLGVVSQNGGEVRWSRVVVLTGVVLSSWAWWEGGGMGGISLVRWATSDHHHLADWWSWGVLAVMDGQLGWGWRWLGLVVGGWWLIKGKSRAAYVSLLTGWWWKGWRRWGWREVAVGVVVVLLVGWASRGKALLSHRVYWWEGVRAMRWSYKGYGWGRFAEISQQYKVMLPDCGSCVSSYAHNLGLEMGVAGGWMLAMAVAGWWWMILRKVDHGVEGAMLVAVMMNMWLDYTYLIPGVWWLFWALLGRMERDD